MTQSSADALPNSIPKPHVNDTPEPAPSAERNSPVAFKWDINFGTIAAIGIPLLVWGYNLDKRVSGIEIKVTQSESFRAARTAQTDKNFVDVLTMIRALTDTMNKQSTEVNNLTYRMGQIEGTATRQDQSINDRIDRLSDSLLGNVQTLSEAVAELKTDVRLANQKIDALDVPRNSVKRGG